jgi:hypothetical protein
MEYNLFFILILGFPFAGILAIILSFIIITTSALNWFIKYGVVSVTVCADWHLKEPMFLPSS